MGRIPPSQGKLLYHITHLDNIASIVEHGLLSRSALLESGNINFTDIADPEIVSRRERYRKSLSQYVLFHFYVRNPFDGAVCKKYGSKNMAIISIRRDSHKRNELFIIPSHPLDCDEPDIYPYEEGFQLINWEILDRETGRDYHDPEIRKACMAECVMDYRIPAEAFFRVYVYDEAAKHRLEGLTGAEKITIEVNNLMFP